MKARLLVHVFQYGDMVHQELPEVEFGDFGELDTALQIKWATGEGCQPGANTNPKASQPTLARIWEKWEHRVFRGRTDLRVMQVIMLDDKKSLAVSAEDDEIDHY